MIWGKKIVQILATFWREYEETGSGRLLDVDSRWSREDIPGDVIDMLSHALHSLDTATEISKEKFAF